MREEARLWLEDAEYDYGSAVDMLDRSRYNYAVWLARQSVEKALKASHLIVLRKPIPKAHNLLALAKSLDWEIPPKVKEALTFLNPHYTVTRYVDASVGKPSDIYDELFASEAIEKAREALNWIRSSVAA